MNNSLINIDLSSNEVTIKDGITKLILKSKELIIDKTDCLEDAAMIAKHMKSIAKKIDDMRTTQVKPLNDQVKTINEKMKKGMIEPLEHYAKELENRMLTFTLEQERKAREEQKKREQEEKDKLFEMMRDLTVDSEDQIISLPPSEIHAVAVPSIIRSASGAMAGIRHTWTYDIIDIMDLSEARPDLIMVNDAAVKEEIKNGTRNISGLKIYQKQEMRVR